MALSDQLSDLVQRVKQVEDRVAAANAKTKADLEGDVKDARESAQEQADVLRSKAQKNRGKLSAWWDGLQSSWHDHVAAVRRGAEERRVAHDWKVAQRAAENAEQDAAFAIDYAYAALEEAQYAVLDADLAHREADELAEA
jgi:hypothetical protein